MEKTDAIILENKKEKYGEICEQLKGLIANVPYLTANLANVSALLNQTMKDINWVGFYLMEDGKLVLGPFQGKPACIEIGIGKGVCGTAVAKDKIMLVEDVHTFPGHIACDASSRSEIVLPVHKESKIAGVLDIDSPYVGRFDEEDREGLSQIVHMLEQELWKKLAIPDKKQDHPADGSERPDILLGNLEKLHTTELGVERIRKNLNLDTEDLVNWCRERIQDPESSIFRKGKNWYVRTGRLEITVNAGSYTIITAKTVS